MAYNPNQMKDAAHRFFLAADRCMEERKLSGDQFQWLPVPAIICRAYGIEISLKAVILIEYNEEVRNMHNLLQLFKKISPQSRAAIATGLSLQEDQLEQKIVPISNAVVEWRYIYEVQSAFSDLIFLRQFAEVIAGLLDSLLGEQRN